MRTRPGSGLGAGWRRRVAGVLLLVAMPMVGEIRGVSGVGTVTEGSAAGADKPLQRDALLEGSERFEQGAKEVTEVNLDKSMLQMAARFMGSDDADAKRLMQKMDFVYVRSFEYAKAGGYRMEDVGLIRGRLDDAKWSHVVKNRSATESTDIWMRVDEDGTLSELMVIAAEPMELTFVHLKGRMTAEELTKMGATYGVPQGAGGKKGGK